MQELSQHDLQAAVQVRQLIFDSDVRSSEYVNRARVLADVTKSSMPTCVPADSMNNIDVTTIGALVPSVRAQLAKVLDPSTGEVLPRILVPHTAFCHHVLS